MAHKGHKDKIPTLQSHLCHLPFVSKSKNRLPFLQMEFDIRLMVMWMTRLSNPLNLEKDIFNSIERTYRDIKYPMKNQKRAFYIFCWKFIMYRGYTRKKSKIPISAELEREGEISGFLDYFEKALNFWALKI